MKTKAAVLYRLGEPLEIEVVDLQAPKEGEVLVKVAGAGVCHSDLSVIEGVIPYPLPSVLGHEGAGVVESVGPGVTGLQAGDHVIFSFIPACGKCFYCLRGKPNLCEPSLRLGGKLFDGTQGPGGGQHNRRWRPTARPCPPALGRTGPVVRPPIGPRSLRTPGGS